MREKEAIFYQRSIEVQARSVFRNAYDLAAFESKVREEVVQLYVPAIAAASGFNFRDAAYELPVLCRVRLLKDLHGFNGINRQVQSKVSASRVGCVKAVHKKRALLLSRARYAYFAR